jgi:hypothetical protein
MLNFYFSEYLVFNRIVFKNLTKKIYYIKNLEISKIFFYIHTYFFSMESKITSH